MAHRHEETASSVVSTIFILLTERVLMAVLVQFSGTSAFPRAGTATLEEHAIAPGIRCRAV